MRKEGFFMSKEKHRQSRFSDFLEIPKEITSNQPKLTIVGFQEMLIENYKGILEYENYYIRLNTYIGTVNINGFDLALNQMTGDDILITGRIDSIELEEISDEQE